MILKKSSFFFTGQILLLVVGAAEARPAPTSPGPVIVVEGSYPGASATVVADTLAAPIEEQIKGVEKMRSMVSFCTNDGTYTLHLTFEPGTDLKIAQVLVQNRVSLAQPILPDLVQRLGITVKKKSAGVLLIVTLTGPDASRDKLFLSHQAVQLREEFARVPGVGDLTLLGAGEPHLCIWVDPEKLRAFGMTVTDVDQALQNQNIQNAAIQSGPPPAAKEKENQVPPKNRVQSAAQGQFEDLIVKTEAGGVLVRLKDVARVELVGDARRSQVHLNGKPVVALCVSLLPGAQPQKVSTAVGDKLSQLRPKFPQGLKAEVAFDFTPNLEALARTAAPEYLLLEPDLPAAASAERTLQTLKQSESILRKVKGVADVLVLSENPFAPFQSSACILVRRASAAKDQETREEFVQVIRTRLKEVDGVPIRIAHPEDQAGALRWGFSIDLTLHGPEGDVVKWGEELTRRLAESKKLIDVGMPAGVRPEEQLYLDIDRNQAQRLGVMMGDVFTTMRIYLGGVDLKDQNLFGRTWQIQVELQRNAHSHREQMEELKKIKIRNSQGKMVPLSDFISIRTISAPSVIERFNGEPMVEITANLAPEISPAEARSLCETLAEKIRKDLRLPADYRLSWLQELPKEK